MKERGKSRKGREGSAPLGGEGGAARRDGAKEYCRKNGAAYSRPYGFPTKLKAVKLYLEERMPSDLVAEEMGVAKGTISWWVQKYRKYGEAGLKMTPGGRRMEDMPDAAIGVSPRIYELT